MVAYYGQPNDHLLTQQHQQIQIQQQHQQQQQLQIQQQQHHQQQPHQQSQPQPVLPRLPQIPKDDHNEEIHLNDIKRMKSTHMNRKITNSHRVGKRSTLMETPSPNAAFVSNKSDDGGVNSRPQSVATDNSFKRISQLNELNGDLSQLSISSHNTSSHHNYHHQYTKSVPKAKSFYFAELGTLQHFMLKHIAVLYLEEILHDYFTLEELADLIDDKKNSTLWGKFVTSLKAGGNKKAPRPKGNFRYLLCIYVCILY
jgi:hypothetical protein